MPQITFSPLDPAEIKTMIALAHRIWHAHYPTMISVQQIDYMLEHGYTSKLINEEMKQGVTWLAIKEGTTMIGFLAAGPYGDQTIKLHKLYLLPEYHSRGIGSLALAEVEKIAQATGAIRIVLNVNKNNQKAIRAYERSGWQITEEVVNDIGNGYVMDDYVMTINVPPTP
ncbi:GNAT family N-acetyltransferase [Pelotalea chapellei]|uniref:GNAT family N-acetyltransferase n=1 Tax=Pelotalea chapellei TaxID=44671 RepID=A0ABS5UD33_9BACT|nr:GNAT family N-acetyltransferase [Pelotalea chapellei]MBT1073624.1 GNAT family N-acetyltransferase [Pelotalea chapellei]